MGKNNTHFDDNMINFRRFMFIQSVLEHRVLKGFHWKVYYAKHFSGGFKAIAYHLEYIKFYKYNILHFIN